MATLTVGTGGQYATISSAVTASKSGDTIDVSAGTYTNDFINIKHNLKLEAVGGTANLVATVQPPNGKGIIDEGGAGVAVSISGFDISGATVPDNNGAGIRYEGGTLVLEGNTIHNNQNGLLANPDPNGAITINKSTFDANGAGDGYTHNIYVGDIASLAVQNSTISNANVGHDIKSRAETNVITGNTITDGTGHASYEIDLTNGGVANIEGNYLQKGANAQNPIGISYGEEGNVYANSSLKVSGNTLVNDDGSPSSTAVKNATSAVADVSNNTVYGWNNVTTGPATTSGNNFPTTRPAASGPPSGSPPAATPAPTPAPVGATPDTIALQLSEDAYGGDAQALVSIDGTAVGEPFAVMASHTLGLSQAMSFATNLGTGEHTLGVQFLNDAYDGATLDRNLYLNSIDVNGTHLAGAAASLFNNGTANFTIPAGISASSNTMDTPVTMPAPSLTSAMA